MLMARSGKHVFYLFHCDSGLWRLYETMRLKQKDFKIMLG